MAPGMSADMVDRSPEFVRSSTIGWQELSGQGGRSGARAGAGWISRCSARRSKPPEFRAPIDRGRGGRPAFDHVLMFKALIPQAMHALSDERTEFLIKDRLVLHALPRAGIGRWGSRRQHDLDVPRSR